MHRPLHAFVALLLAAPLAAQAQALLGGWRGVGEINQGEQLEFRADGTATTDGDVVRWTHVRDGLIRVAMGEQTLDMQYALSGSRLTLTFLGDSYPYERAGATPPPGGIGGQTPPGGIGGQNPPIGIGGQNPPGGIGGQNPPGGIGGQNPPGGIGGQNPLGGNPLGGNPLGGNPLGGNPPPDPFARAFRGDAIALTLEGDRASGYQGTLEFKGTRYPAIARAQDAMLDGRFRVGDRDYEFRARLDGDKLTLESGGATYTLTAPSQPTNPLAGGGGLGGGGLGGGGLGGGGLGGGGLGGGGLGGSHDGPAPLQGVADAPGQVWRHPRGWFTFEMPQGWSVWNETEDGILLNPGFKETDSLDAIIAVSYGQVEANERNLPVDRLLDAKEGEMRQELAGQGIELQKPERGAQLVSVGEVPGAMQSWRGRAASGASVEVWVGALVKRDYYLAVVAILVDGKGGRFMPQIKRVFQTLRPTPPEANPQLAQALVGRSFTGSQTGRDGNAFQCTYTFQPGGSVQKQMIVSGGQVGGSSDEAGSYEVVGDQVFLYFRDGQDSGQVVIQGNQIAGLKFGDAVYRAR